MPASTSRHQAPLALIKLARRLFANTPVGRLRLVAWLYRQIVAYAWRGQDVTADFRGVRLTVSGGDAWFPPSIVGGFYEAIEMDLLERLAAGSRTVIDVGANIGIYACVAASRLPEGGQLIAFEPAPRNLRYLHHNLAANGLTDRVQVHALAIGEQPGETLLHLDATCGGNNSLAAGVVAHPGGTLRVQVTTLDTFVAEAGLDGPVDLVKIDVEGFDGYVLRGAANLLREHRPALLIEFIPRDLIRAGYPPAEFLDHVFAVYPEAFLINEPRGRLERCERADLDRYAHRGVYANLNLVAVARPEHLEIVRKYAGLVGAA